LFEKPPLNARQNGWLEFLSEYDFDIKHKNGKENKVADALSRRVHKMNAIAISMYMKKSKDIILEVVTTHQHYVQVK